MKIRTALSSLAIGACLVAANPSFGATLTWTNALGTALNATTNWSPAQAPANGDTLQWNGTAAGNLVLSSIGLADATPGYFFNLLAGQTGSVTIQKPSVGGSNLRLNSWLNVASGAGQLTFGGNGVAFGVGAGVGNSAAHNFTNHSSAPVLFGPEVNIVAGGGGTHTYNLRGAGGWKFSGNYRVSNAGGNGLSLAINDGPVTLVATNFPGNTYAGGNACLVTLNSGTLIMASPVAIGGDAGALYTLVLAGGNLDSSVADLVNANNNAQTWSGNFTFVGSQNLDLGTGNVNLNGSRTVTVSANTLTVGGAITNTGALTKAGAGTLLLSGANTYSGGTVVSNGVLKMANAAALGATGASLTVHGTLDLNGNSPTVRNLSGNGTGVIDDVAGAGSDTLTVSNSSSSTFSGVIRNTSGTVALTKIGANALTLAGANTYSGNTAVNEGTLLVNGSLGAGAVTVSSGATLGGTGTVGGNVDWQLAAAAAFSLTPTNAVGSNSTALTVSGTVTLNDNAITVNVLGGTPLGVGTYKLMGYNNSGSSGSFAAGSPTYTGAGVASGTVSTVSTSGGAVTLTVANTGLSTTWTNNGDGNWTTGSNWNSNPAYPQNPGDAAFLGVGSAFTTVTLDAGISLAALTFTNANSFLVADAGNALTMNNPYGAALITVNAGSSNAISPAVSLATNLTITAGSGTGLTLTNLISNTSGSQTLTLNGAGTVVLSAANTYGPASGSVGTILGGGGVLQMGNGSSIGAGDLSMSGSATIRANSAFTLANNILDNAGTVTIDDNGNNLTLSGVISGAGAIGKNGAGLLSLSGVNSFTGGASISAGAVKLLNASGLSVNGNVNLGAGTTLDLNGNSPVLGGLNSSFSDATVDSLSGGAVTLTVGATNAFATFAGSIKNTSGSLTLVKAGTGTQTLTGTNSYTGGTTINAGTLQIGNGGTNGNLGSGTLLNNGGLSFNLTGTNVFASQITGTGAVNLANSSLALKLHGNNTFTGPINMTFGGGGSLWITNASALGVGPKLVLCNNGNNSIHLDGSSGGINVDGSIAFQLSNGSGVLFNDAGSNTISGPIGMVNGNGNCYVLVNSGFLDLAGGVSTVAGNNPRTLVLGGAGNGLVSGNVTDAGPVASLTKLDAGTWTLTGTANNYSGPTVVDGGTLVINGDHTGSGNLTVSNVGTLIVNGHNYGSGAVTVATNGTLGGVGFLYSTTTWQVGSKGKFTTSASLSTPLTIYGNVTLNNNAIEVFVDGGTPLPAGQYPLLVEGNTSLYTISGSAATAAIITGAGLQAGMQAIVSSSATEVKLVVYNTSTWTFDGNGNWTTGANWNSNPNYPDSAGEFGILGVGSSLITINLNASQTIGGLNFTNVNSFAITNAANVLTLDNSGSGSQISVAAGTANAIATGVSLNENTTVNTVSGSALALSGNVSGVAGLTVAGNGTLALSGANTYGGATALSGGTLLLGSTNAISTGTLTITGGKLDSSVPNLSNQNNNAQIWNGSFGFTGTESLNLGNGAVTLGNNVTLSVVNNRLTVGGPVSGAFALTYGSTNVLNNGTLELNGANTFTGLTLVSGTVALGSDDAFGTAAQIQLSPAASTPNATNLTIMSKDATPRAITNGVSCNAFDGPYILGGTGDLTFSGTIATGNGYKRFSVFNKTTFSGLVTDNGSPSGPVAKDGSGTLILTANNTTTKPFRVDAGTLALGSTTAIGSGALTINGGGLDSTVANLVNANNNAQTWAGSFYFVGSENLNLGTGSVTMSADTAVTVSNNTLTVGGAITGAGRSLTKSGNGTLVLSGANAYSNTVVTAGTLSIAQATLATNATINVATNAVLQLNFSTTNQVAGLILNGATQPNGVYGSSVPGGYLAGTGYLRVQSSGPSAPALLTNSVSGSTLSLSWPAGEGWRLQVQTNSRTIGLSNNWTSMTDGSASSTNIIINKVDPTVFYRLVYP